MYRRATYRILGRGESRNSLTRDIFHGWRGQLRQHYQAAQENQLGALGLMVNVVVLWQTVYIQAALDHLVAHGVRTRSLPTSPGSLTTRPPHDQPQRPIPHHEPSTER